MESTGLSDATAAEKLLDLLGADALDQLDQPIEAALSLPNPAYTSEAFFQLENDRLFARAWMLAGYGHQVPEPGDVHPVSVAGQPLVPVHGHDGLCFHNEYRFPELEAGRGAGLPHYPDLPEAWHRRGPWFHMFPSLGVELFPDQFAVFHVIPVAPGLSREEIHIYLVGDAADGPEHEAARNDVFETWRSLNEEDIWIVEELQEGRRSSGFDGGRFSPHWGGANHHFSKLVVDGIR